MKHIKLRNAQQFDGGYTDLFILGVTDLRSTSAAGVWSYGSDFTAAATTQTFTLLNLNIGDFVHGAGELFVETALVAPGLTAATLALGYTGTTTGIIGASDIFTNAAAAGGCFGATSATAFMTQAASKALLGTLTLTGANAVAITAGRLWLYAKISRIADLMDAPTGNRYE